MTLKEIRASGREILILSLDEIQSFAGNCLELQTRYDELVLAISHTATQALSADNLAALQKHLRFLEVNVPTIEKYGGGGVSRFYNLFCLFKLSIIFLDTLYVGGSSSTKW